MPGWPDFGFVAFSSPKLRRLGVDSEACGLPPGAADERVEARAVAAVDALLELGVDVERHLRVGVADLAHDPLDVEVVGEQRDRDVRAARRGARQRREPAGDEALAGALGGLGDDLADALARQATAAQVGDEIVLAAGGRAAAAQPVEMFDGRRAPGSFFA